MPYIIRNSALEICGLCTNRPGEGNLLPDGNPEIIEKYEEETPEIVAFKEYQATRLSVKQPDRLQEVIDYIAKQPDAPDELKSAASK